MITNPFYFNNLTWSLNSVLLARILDVVGPNPVYDTASYSVCYLIKQQYWDVRAEMDNLYRRHQITTPKR